MIESFAEESVVSRLEENVAGIASVTQMQEEGCTPEQILERLTKGMDLQILETMETSFYCNCSKERVERTLISLGRKELQSMIEDGEEIEVRCHFCNHAYTFSVEELEKLKQAVR